MRRRDDPDRWRLEWGCLPPLALIVAIWAALTWAALARIGVGS